MSTNKKIAHNTITQIIGKGISTLLGLIAIAIMTRYLGQEKFGWYITTISFLQCIGILIDFGMIPLTSQMLAEPHVDNKKLLKNLLGFRVVTAFVFLLCAPLIALFFPYPAEVKAAIAITTVSFFAVSLNQVFTGFYQFKLKMHIQAIAEVISRIVLVVGLWLIIAQKASFISVMMLISVSSIAFTLAMYLPARKMTRIALGFDWPIWKAIIIKMWPIALSIMFNVVYLKGDVLILSLFDSQTNVGIYGAAYRVIDIVAQVAMMFMGIMLPLLGYAWSRNDRATFKQRYQQSFDAILMLGLPIVVGLFILAKPIMVFVAGNDFLASTKPLQILSIAVFGLYFGAIFGHVAVAIDKQKQTLWIYITGAILTLGGYLYAIPKFGMFGAAWMSVFSELYVGILLFFTIKKYIKDPLHKKTAIKVVVSAGIMGVGIYALPQLHVLLLVIIGGGIYAASLFATKAISPQFIKEILSVK